MTNYEDHYKFAVILYSIVFLKNLYYRSGLKSSHYISDLKWISPRNKKKILHYNCNTKIFRVHISLNDYNLLNIQMSGNFININ